MTIAEEAGNAFGGHLVEARISGTCELFVRLLDGEIRRRTDAVTGFQLMDWDDESICE